MKKTIGKPENWQDFESLCKKLWGEIWQIPNTIKKNGRLGQNQSGVDVYGIPKNSLGYWGIQCKGKDDYSNAKLTEKEIIEELEKAKAFKPKLEVYIIATTSNKDAKIEEFARLLSLQNEDSGSFEILLFCWEDIVDLIEENTNTLHWYLNGINQRGNYDFRILFDDFNDSIVLKPTFERKIKKYVITEKTRSEINIENLEKLSIFEPLKFNPFIGFVSDKVNKSWVEFELILENNGLKVLEDWRFTITFKEGVKVLDDGSSGGFRQIHTIVFPDDETKSITYRPNNNSSLIQKDNRYFEVSVLLDIHATKVIAEWELLARDFDKNETIEIEIQPQYIEKVEYEDIAYNATPMEDETVISYYRVKTEDD